MPDLSDPCPPLDELCRVNYENESDDAFGYLIQGILADDDE